MIGVERADAQRGRQTPRDQAKVFGGFSIGERQRRVSAPPSLGAA
jgi:hypothetical protein